MMQAAIYGLEGLVLKEDERAFFLDAEPAGFILFRRNCENQEQLLRLTDSLRSIAGRDDVPILIDQEGGRVARMRPPEWPAFPAAEKFANLYRAAPSSAIEAVRANARALALMLRSVGVNVNALPLLDVRQEGATDIIGDRALGSEPMQVAALGRAVLDGMASAGVIGIVKHMPGHGRALVDSHKELPIVTASAEELEIDLEPFERLAAAPMFGVDSSELAVVAILALIFIGPKELPKALQTLGYWIGRIRGMARHFTAGIESMRDCRGLRLCRARRCC